VTEEREQAPATVEDEAAPPEVAEVASAEAPRGEPGPDDAPPGEPEPDDAPPGEPEAAAVEHDLDELLARARERDEYLSLAQRTQADFENYRKRASREMSVAERRGVAKLARELLPPIDNLTRALESDAAGAGEDFLAGIRLVHGELVAALERLGIERYSPEGERFDPEVHEAMAQQPVDGAESGTIVEVYQQGYRIDGNVLRPARVVVAA
jgi:molecular chaperone GrpE